MEKTLYESILQIQNGDTDELLVIIEKYVRKLNYDEVQTDLTISLIELLLSLNLNKFITLNDGAIVNYICHAISNKSVDLFRKFILKKVDEVELNLDIINLRIEDSTDTKLFIKDLLNQLSEKQQFVIKARYFNCHSDIEIANYLSISRQAVNKIKNQSLKILRDYMENYVLV